jgi:hypothetical protein
MLPKLQAMKEGQVQLFETGGDRFQIIWVMSFKTEPIDEATAAPRIQQYLWNRRSSEVIAKEMKKIREQAKIEYVGEFADGVAGESMIDAEAKPQAKSGEPPKEQLPK